MRHMLASLWRQSYVNENVNASWYLPCLSSSRRIEVCEAKLFCRTEVRPSVHGIPRPWRLLGTPRRGSATTIGPRCRRTGGVDCAPAFWQCGLST